MLRRLTTLCTRCDVSKSSVPCHRCPLRAIDSRIPEVEASDAVRKSSIFLESGRIRLVREIGRGGMGTVFSAVDESLERIVAVKFLRPELQADPAMVEWFRQETQAAAAIVHKNVVTIYSSGQHDGTDYFVAEYIDGPSLERLLAIARAKGEQFPLTCALWMLDQAGAGLAAVHAVGVIHHDIKPGNVMVEVGEGRVVIMDFGIGGLVRPDLNGQGKSSIGGTPAYMAPEAFQKSPLRGRAGRLADVYSLGVTIFETLTGVRPFDGRTWVVARDQHINMAPFPPSLLNAKLTPALDSLVLRCLAKNPAHRYQSVEEVRTALGRAFGAACLSAESKVEANAHDGEFYDNDNVEDRRRHIARIAEDADEPVKVVVADPTARFVAVVQEAVRLMDPRGVVQASRTVSKALELARRHLPHTIIAPLWGADINGLDLLALVDSDDVLGKASRVMLVTDYVGDRVRHFLERKGAASILSADASPADVARALYLVVPPLSSRTIEPRR
jgi:CheY-like chemotaxis protein/predicted Ser/Thr protein kinase